jgi:hypothetical protein
VADASGQLPLAPQSATAARLAYSLSPQIHTCGNQESFFGLAEKVAVRVHGQLIAFAAIGEKGKAPTVAAKVAQAAQVDWRFAQPLKKLFARLGPAFRHARTLAQADFAIRVNVAELTAEADVEARI